MDAFVSENRAVITEISRYCLDLSKLVFGGIILTEVLDLGLNHITMIVVGLLIVALFAVIGIVGLFLTNKRL